MKPTAEFWRLIGWAVLVAAIGWGLGQVPRCEFEFERPKSEVSK